MMARVEGRCLVEPDNKFLLTLSRTSNTPTHVEDDDADLIDADDLILPWSANDPMMTLLVDEYYDDTDDDLEDLDGKD